MDLEPFPIDDAVPVPRRTRWQLIQEAVLAVPNLLKLLGRLLVDPRVPRRRKLLVSFAGIYVASPIDLIPELLIPVVGRLDDLAVVVVAIHFLLQSVEPEVLAEYWDGSRDSLELVGALLEWGSELMPGSIRRMLAG